MTSAQNNIVQIKFLLGPAGYGKTYRCLAEVRRELLADPAGAPLVFLAPKQATFQLERQLLAEGGLEGYTRLRILSFERLAEWVLGELGAPPPELLSDAGRAMVIRALLEEKGPELRVYRFGSKLNGLAQQLSKLFREMHQARLTERDLRRAAAELEPGNPLADKLGDISLLWEAYRVWRQDQRMTDGADLLDQAAGVLEAETRAGGSKIGLGGIWLDGFAELTPQELNLLATLVPASKRATLAFCLAEDQVADDSWLASGGIIRQTFSRCRARLAAIPGVEVTVEELPRRPETSRFADNPILRHLERHWSDREPPANHAASLGGREKPPPVRIILCSNPEAEAAEAAREILRFVRAGGRYREAAVLVRSLDGYHDVLRRVFRRYAIPSFLDRREPIAHHPLAELTRYGLRVAVLNWRHDDWFGALKTGLVPAHSDELDRLETEAAARGWNGQTWQRPLRVTDKPAVEQRLESVRQQVIPAFERWVARLFGDRAPPDLSVEERESRPVAGRELAAAIEDLWTDLGVASRLDAWDAAAVNSGAPAIHGTVWAELLAWNKNLELAFVERRLPLGEWLSIVEAGLAGLTVGVIPPNLDQVLIGAIDRSRNPDLRLVIVAGVNETVFPALQAAPVLLTESDREILQEKGLVLSFTRRQQLGQERFYAYIAWTRARERLVITASARDANDRPLNLSPFLGTLKRLLPDIEFEEAPVCYDWRTAEHACETLPAVLAGMRLEQAPLPVPLPAGTDGERVPAGRERGGAWHRTLELRGLAPWRPALEALAAYTPARTLNPVIAARLYGPELRVAVTALEAFAACPFKFFVQTGLRAAEWREFTVDPRDEGSFQHEVLARFHQELTGQGKRWRDLSPEHARERIGRIAVELAEKYREGLFLADSARRRLVERLTAGLQEFIEAMIEWMQFYRFDPAAVELGFGREDDPLPAWEIDLGGGRRLALRGKIDRVDLETGQTSARPRCVVVDYKSGLKKVDPVLLRHGIQVQLPAYLAAVPRLANGRQILGARPLQPAGLFYVSLRGRYETARTRDEALSGAAASRRAAYRHSGRFVFEDLEYFDRGYRQISSGQFAYQLKRDGSLNRQSKDPMPSGDFRRLLREIEPRLAEMARRIYAGDMAPAPYRHRTKTACAQCDYAAICRFDPWRHSYRDLAENSPDEEKSE